MPLSLSSICNSVMTDKCVDHYSFQAQAGQRIIVDCAARGIDSKMNPVLIVADAAGQDLLVERRGGAIAFDVPADGQYTIKVHELTFKGGPEYFYRLAVKQVDKDAAVTRLPATKAVSSVSWQLGLAEQADAAEVEPNNGHSQAQQITLPCDLSGELFSGGRCGRLRVFGQRQGDIWWVEVGRHDLAC